MSASIVQTTAATESATATTLAITGLTTAGGNLSLLAVGIHGIGITVSSVVDSAGNTWQRLTSSYNSGTASLEVWTTSAEFPNKLSSGTVTITFSATVLAVARFWEISGANNTAPSDQLVSANGAGVAGNPASGTTGTLAGSADLCLGISANDFGGAARTYSGTTFTAGAPTTQWPASGTGDTTASANGIQLHSADLALSSTTGQAYSTTLSTTSQWAATVIALAPVTAWTTINGPGYGFTGYGFAGAEFAGVGTPSGVTSDLSLTTDSTVTGRTNHITDASVTTDKAVTGPATHGQNTGPGNEYTGFSLLGYGFSGVGSSGTYISQIVTDTSVVTDVATRSAIAYIRTCADSSVTTDSVTSSAAHSRTCTDSSVTTDSASRSTNAVRGISDTSITTDAVSRTLVLSRGCTDSSQTNDVAIRTTVQVRPCADSSLTIDAAGRTTNAGRVASDSSIVTDIVHVVVLRACLDSVLTTDSVTIHLVIQPRPGTCTISVGLAYSLTISVSPVYEVDGSVVPVNSVLIGV
jgi:hypothetical protein